MKGQQVLPGVAYLEMVRVAVEKAVGLLNEDDQSVIKLKDVVSIRPILQKNQPVEVHIGLYPEESGEIAYEVYALSPMRAMESNSYTARAVRCSAPYRETPSLDIKTLQAECNRRIMTRDEML